MVKAVLEFIVGILEVISALLLEPAGTPVPDGTVVQFFTTLGRIEEQGRTNDGDSKIMRTTAFELSDLEIKAVASYASGLRQ